MVGVTSLTRNHTIKTLSSVPMRLITDQSCDIYIYNENHNYIAYSFLEDLITLSEILM